MTLESIVKEIRARFTDHPPNGWLLGWDEARHYDLVTRASEPFSVTNATSFDYAFCNRFEVHINDDSRDRIWVLTIRLSFILDVFSLHWTEYHSLTGGAVVKNVLNEHWEVERRIQTALERVGLYELPDEWAEENVEGLELELSDATNVTLSKCLFEDYSG